MTEYKYSMDDLHWIIDRDVKDGKVMSVQELRSVTMQVAMIGRLESISNALHNMLAYRR